MADKEEADRAALLELQDKMIMVHDAARKVATQERVRSRQKQTQELTLTELKALPENANCFKAVGKAYFLSTRGTVVKELEDSVKAADADLASIAQNKAAVETKIKETENELRELIKHNPGLVQSLGNFRAA